MHANHSVFADVDNEDFTIMTTSKSTPKSARRWVLAVTVATLIAAGSWTGLSQASEGEGWGGGHHHGMAEMTLEMQARHVDKMVAHLLGDATPEQKTKVTALANAAFVDLQPLQVKRRDAHQEGIKILSEATVNRAALEQVRSTEMQLAEQSSKRITQALADIADVLTPAQRLRLAEHLQHRMGDHY